MVKSQRYLTPGYMTHESDRHEDVPWGVFGGRPGAGGKVEIRNIRTGEIRYEPAKFSGVRMKEGDIVSYLSPSGGGYGDPLEREPERVLDDVLDGFITADHARKDYGVVLKEVDDGYGWALDREATGRLRAQMRSGKEAKERAEA